MTAHSDGIKQSSEWRTVLIGGLRKGGNGYFALDVTNPDAPQVLWEYTNPTDVGETWSEPFIGKVNVTNTSWTTNPGGTAGWRSSVAGTRTPGHSEPPSWCWTSPRGKPLKTFTSFYTRQARR